MHAMIVIGLALGAGPASARTHYSQHHLRHYFIPPLPDPDLNYPSPYIPGEQFPSLPEGFTMTITHIVEEGPSQPPQSPDIATGRAVAERLSACWQPPQPPSQSETLETTLRLSFNRDGAVIGSPRITYVKAAGGAEAAETVRRSILRGVADCTPLRFTNGLGSAIAGVPFTIRFVARRPEASTH